MCQAVRLACASRLCRAEALPHMGDGMTAQASTGSHDSVNSRRGPALATWHRTLTERQKSEDCRVDAWDLERACGLWGGLSDRSANNRGVRALPTSAHKRRTLRWCRREHVDSDVGQSPFADLRPNKSRPSSCTCLVTQLRAGLLLRLTPPGTNRSIAFACPGLGRWIRCATKLVSAQPRRFRCPQDSTSRAAHASGRCLAAARPARWSQRGRLARTFIGADRSTARQKGRSDGSHRRATMAPRQGTHRK
jgi:hypothetical protein